MGFKLSKWYLDCITDSGDVSIAYTGIVDWGFVHLGYSSLLQTTGKQVGQQHTLRDQEQPHIDGASVSWSMKPFGIEGLWQSDSLPVRETVFESPDGSVDWHCFIPRAHAQMGDRRGLGYAERLTMTIPPWRIPIQHLRWGRFLTDSDWIVWIDWEGPISRRLVYRNGESVAPATLEDFTIGFESGELLTLSDPMVLRDGPLGSTALSAIPGVEKTFPGQLLRIIECKWRSRGRLQRSTGEIVEGWAIHERVSWPQ